jgi:hypothetical protein
MCWAHLNEYTRVSVADFWHDPMTWIYSELDANDYSSAAQPRRENNQGEHRGQGDEKRPKNSEG